MSLAERRLRIRKPRLRRKGKQPGKSTKVEIPAYAAMRTPSRIGGRMVDILMRGVSTRNDKPGLPEMDETVGDSKSPVSREFIEASEKSLKEWMERRFDNADIRLPARQRPGHGSAGGVGQTVGGAASVCRGQFAGRFEGVDNRDFAEHSQTTSSQADRAVRDRIREPEPVAVSRDGWQQDRLEVLSIHLDDRQFPAYRWGAVRSDTERDHSGE